jgi:hypothetical protein
VEAEDFVLKGVRVKIGQNELTKLRICWGGFVVADDSRDEKYNREG